LKLSISNIAWDERNDAYMLENLNDQGFDGIEVAPTRVVKERPYDHLNEATEFMEKVKRAGLCVPSMQSIWFGRSERVFFDEVERQTLLEYTKKAIGFANILSCENLVFGSPRNRQINDLSDEAKGIVMFKAIAKEAEQKGTCFSIEANPAIYNTNYINKTEDAFELAKRVESNGFKVNVDFGTIIENREDLKVIADHLSLVNHVHISEPFLAPIEQRSQHKELCALLNEKGYNRFVSIEMKNPGDVRIVEDVMAYVREVFR